jgi:uncharacterized membrane protein YgcG
VSNPESNYMAAAEKAIADLEAYARTAAAAAVQAKESADRAERSAARWKKLTVVLGIVIVLLGGAFAQLHIQAIASCHAGNDFRTGQSNTWDKFISLATAGQKEDTRSQQIIANLENYVHQVDAPKSCNSIFLP